MHARPLFVTRKFRRSAGGMETLAAEVWRSVSQHNKSARLIALGRGNGHLFWWLPVTLLRTATALIRQQADVVICGDAVVFAALRPVLALTRVRRVVMVHGLDLTWDKPVYQWWVRGALCHAHLVIAVSEPTAEIARSLGCETDRIVVVRPGVEAPPVTANERARARRAIVRTIGTTDANRFLLTLGRVVPRKGSAWFVEQVLPRLPHDVVYLVAGEGPDADRVKAAAARAGVLDRVRLLGWVSDAQREELLQGADLFVQPNIKVPGDVEGFGIVVIEAALRGTPVIGARLEGITDAIVDGETGILCNPGDASAWITTVHNRLADLGELVDLGQRYRSHAVEIYGRDRMTRELSELLDLEPPLVSLPAGAR
jgi:glycosyltransferase involved in cell wall biosynthesis